MYRCLSYKLRLEDHAYPGEPTMHFEPNSSMKKGDAVNTFNITIFNHFGTHMDGSFHFNPNGAKLYEEPQERFISEKPLVLDIPKGEGEFVTVEDLQAHAEAIAQADMLFIRSGYGKIRAVDNAAYADRGPAVAPDAAQYLVDNFQNLKALGMDWISLGSPLHPAEATKAHQIMLGKFGNDPILIVEDMNLEIIRGETPKRIFLNPLLIEGVDSSWVSVLAEV